MTKKKTHEEYEETILKKNLIWFPLETYINSRTAILHECPNGHIVSMRPEKVIDGRGCKECADKNSVWSNDKYLSTLKQKRIDIVPLEEYKSYSCPILHECPNGHKWKVSPDSLLQGKGCPVCADKDRKGLYTEKFFQKNIEKAQLPGILYCIVLVDRKTSERVCIKIGITQGTSNKDVLKRAAGFKGYEPRIQKLVHGTLEEVYHLEQWLHEQWSHKKYKSPWRFGGHTELFQLEDEIIRSIPTTI